MLQGFEIGSGFAGSRLLGSEHNDEFYMAPDGQIRTRTNRWVFVVLTPQQTTMQTARFVHACCCHSHASVTVSVSESRS